MGGYEPHVVVGALPRSSVRASVFNCPTSLHRGKILNDGVECKLNPFLKTLLRHGANPDLRDEDGKTPLDKARERGHSEVVAILQSPGEL